MFSNEEKEIEGKIRNARYVCKNDIENNPDLSFISYYYKAIADICLGYISDAYKELEKSIEIIENDIKFIFTFCGMISGSGFEKLTEDLEKKHNLYNNIKDAILKESKELVGSAQRKILIKKKKFINVFKNIEEYKIDEEIQSLSILGFDYVFFLYEKASFWQSLGMLALGAFQICLGCLILSVPIVGISSISLINAGITNIGKGVEMMMNGKSLKNWKKFWDFKKADFFQVHLFSQLILEQDEKKDYNLYKMNLKNNDFLRQKIMINRENTFKNFVENKLKEIDLNLEEENAKIDELKKNMKNIKKKVAEKVMEKLEKTRGYQNILLYFDGDKDKINKYLMDKINSKIINFDISKEIKVDELSEQELIEKIADKIKKEITESIEKDDNIKKNSKVLVNLKNEMLEKSNERFNEEITNKNKEFEQSLKTENEKTKQKFEDLNQNFQNEQKQINENIKKLQEKSEKSMEKSNELQKESKEIQEKNTKFQEKTKDFNEKVKLFNSGQSDITIEELEKTRGILDKEQSELQTGIANLNEKKKFDGEQKALKEEFKKNEEESKKLLDDLKQKNDDLQQKIQNDYNDAVENIKKEQKSFNEEIKKKSEENIKSINNLTNDDIKIDKGNLVFNVETNKDIGEEFCAKYNPEFKKKCDIIYNDFKEKIEYISNEQVSNIEADENNKLEKNRKVKMDNLRTAINKEANPVVKCYSNKYEYYSPDMEIIGKQILKNYPEFEYFNYTNIDTLKKQIQKKQKILIGNFNDSKSWNTVCIIPDGKEFTIIYKNPKGLPYDKNFENFLKTIGVEEYLVKVNNFDQTKDIEKSSCIFSLKNLENFATSLKTDKQNY